MGNYWLLSHLPKNDNWVTAEADAPWRRYTNLQINIQQSYARARVDWWFVEYRPTFPTLSWTLVILLPALTLLMLALFGLEVWRAVRSARAVPQVAEAEPVPAEGLMAST